MSESLAGPVRAAPGPGPVAANLNEFVLDSDRGGGARSAADGRARRAFGPMDRRLRYISMDIEAPRPWSPQPESRAAAAGIRVGLGLGRLESTHRWAGQLEPGPRYPPAPARARSHRLGTRPAQEERRGPIREGSG